MSGRLIDPRQDVERALWRREGVRTQRDLEDRDEAAYRFGHDGNKRLVIVPETLNWFRAGVGASGDSSTGYIMRVGGQSSDTAWASYVLPLNALGQGRLLAARLYSSEVCTAGVARLALRIVEGSDTELFAIDDVEIDAVTNTRQVATKWDWENAKQFSGSATLEARIITESSFAPTTAAMTAVMTFGSETWV
jgi:hypothetical protein